LRSLLWRKGHDGGEKSKEGKEKGLHGDYSIAVETESEDWTLRTLRQRRA
jgi:hypothetical protein